MRSFLWFGAGFLSGYTLAAITILGWIYLKMNRGN